LFVFSVRIISSCSGFGVAGVGVLVTVLLHFLWLECSDRFAADLVLVYTCACWCLVEVVFSDECECNGSEMEEMKMWWWWRQIWDGVVVEVAADLSCRWCGGVMVRCWRGGIGSGDTGKWSMPCVHMMGFQWYGILWPLTNLLRFAGFYCGSLMVSKSAKISRFLCI
jgi:hypothetical protein